MLSLERSIKIIKAFIIFPIHHSTWVANIVPMRKKSGQIRICVDFKSLNHASLKDNFSLPMMDQILQTVAGSEMMSFLNGFFRYNQIGVVEEDQHKMTFMMPWGTFSYQMMPFGLVNVGATFQSVMNSTFGHLLNKPITIYLDDMTLFLRRQKMHLKELREVLQKYREHGVSLNPKKSIFCVTEGKLLGHIVSKQGIRIDLQRVKAIQQLCLPVSHNNIRYFFGQINFLKIFVPDFAKTTKLWPIF